MIENKIFKKSNQEPFVMVYNYMIESEKLTDSEFMLYLTLLKYADSKKKCFPSIKKLADGLGKKQRQIINLLQNLQTKGFLSIEHRVSNKGKIQSNLYTIFTDKSLFMNKKEKGLTTDTDQSTEISPENSNKLIINHTSTQEESQGIKAFSRNMVNEIYDYDILTTNQPQRKDTYHSIMELLLEILNSTAKTIRCKQEDMPIDKVKAQMLKLNHKHISYVVDQVEKQTTIIHDQRLYWITALFNSYHSLKNYDTNQGNQKPNPKNKFNNYPQRQHDDEYYEAMERHLLNRKD